MLRDFKSNKVKILVSTDVAARGLDIKTVKNVINFDIARDIDSHTHRVGRTGRAGEKGTAFTLITQKEDRFAGELVRHLETSGQIVPPELLNLAMKNPRFGDSRNRGGRRGRGGRGGCGRGRGGGRGVGYNRGNVNPDYGLLDILTLLYYRQYHVLCKLQYGTDQFSKVKYRWFEDSKAKSMAIIDIINCN